MPLSRTSARSAMCGTALKLTRVTIAGGCGDIWVNESDRGRGVGRQVLALVEAEVRRLHGMSLGLSVLGSNDGARRLYERSGYEVVTARMRKLL